MGEMLDTYISDREPLCKNCGKAERVHIEYPCNRRDPAGGFRVRLIAGNKHTAAWEAVLYQRAMRGE